MKKIICVLLVLVMTLSLVACGNRQTFDVTYTFDRAIIKLPNGEIVDGKMPLHIVEKKIPSIDEKGTLIKPEAPNGYKFEYLATDTVRDMLSCLSFEVEREREFAPIKNKEGTDSVVSARELLAKNGVIC